MKKRLIGLFLIIIGGLFGLSSCGINKTDIVSTCFAGHDLARAVAKDKKTSSMLLKPVEELHDYSPSPADVERAISAEIFIYIGGESDEVWVEKQILPKIDKTKTKVINMIDVVKNGGNTYSEENPISAEKEDSEEAEEAELDEHVWNSIINQKLIINEICNVLISIDKENENSYISNKNEYIKKID